MGTSLYLREHQFPNGSSGVVGSCTDHLDPKKASARVSRCFRRLHFGGSFLCLAAPDVHMQAKGIATFAFNRDWDIADASRATGYDGRHDDVTTALCRGRRSGFRTRLRSTHYRMRELVIADRPTVHAAAVVLGRSSRGSSRSGVPVGCSVHPRFCPDHWLSTATDRCRRTLISSTSSANDCFRSGPVVRPEKRHRRLWVAGCRPAARTRSLSAVTQLDGAYPLTVTADSLGRKRPPARSLTGGRWGQRALHPCL